MRIAIFSWESLHSVYVGGVGNHVSELAVALQRKGNDVHIFTRLGEHQKLYECVQGVHYHRCPHEFDNDFVEEINNMCRAFVDAYYAEEDFGGPFDVVHAHDWLTANAMSWIKQAKGRKAILTMHSTEYGRCGNNFASGTSEMVSHIEWSGVYHADQVIAVSKTLASELCWLYDLPEYKVGVIYNGVNCNEFDGWIDDLAVRKMYEIGPYDPIILFVGRMVYQKGPDILMEAIPSILKHYPETKFVFGGDGGMRWQVEERAHHLGIHQSLRFLGHIGGWRLKDLFKTADFVCVPSRNEPFGIVILEAWSAGKPVVATVNGGPKEFVLHDVNGYKVEANPDSLGWGMGNMMMDHDHAQWMGRNGRLAVETVFSWDTIADETIKVYHT
ncbi:MAG: glycosyltransferase family 4 protein [Candidatus Omnitrophica bacterium]|nr:glycosyltransferase family 4 protein [Candidatus Omnitrophota bacterium]